ncbi:MAG: hypothetical protein ACHQAY_21845 [Hyphomicrobiales bacterium]
MPRLCFLPRRRAPFLASIALVAAAFGPASNCLAAGSYDFVAAPATDLNRVYRVDRSTGEMGACQYGLQEGTIGVTICYPAGEGGGPQAPGDYTILASRHDRESGVFRLNMRTGEMSNCYVLEEKVVCTPSAK